MTGVLAVGVFLRFALNLGAYIYYLRISFFMRIIIFYILSFLTSVLYVRYYNK